MYFWTHHNVICHPLYTWCCKSCCKNTVIYVKLVRAQKLLKCCIINWKSVYTDIPICKYYKLFCIDVTTYTIVYPLRKTSLFMLIEYTQTLYKFTNLCFSKGDKISSKSDFLIKTNLWSFLCGFHLLYKCRKKKKQFL